jgi:hypothetical protein
MFKFNKDYYISLTTFGFVAILIGAFIRLYFPLEATIPLNDGGLFFSFLQESKFAFRS